MFKFQKHIQRPLPSVLFSWANFAVNTIPILKVEHWWLSYFFEKYILKNETVFFGSYNKCQMDPMVFWSPLTFNYMDKNSQNIATISSSVFSRRNSYTFGMAPLSLFFFFFNFSNLTIQKSYIFCTLGTQWDT